MIFEFDKNDDLTKKLQEKKYLVSENFVKDTTIQMGYTFMSKHLQFVYLVKEHSVFLINFFPYEDNKYSANTLRDIKNFIDIMKSVFSLNLLIIPVNPYPTEEQKQNQKILLKFGRKMGAEIIESSPVNFAIIDLHPEQKKDATT